MLVEWELNFFVSCAGMVSIYLLAIVWLKEELR